MIFTRIKKWFTEYRYSHRICCQPKIGDIVVPYETVRSGYGLNPLLNLPNPAIVTHFNTSSECVIIQGYYTFSGREALIHMTHLKRISRIGKTKKDSADILNLLSI